MKTYFVQLYDSGFESRYKNFLEKYNLWKLTLLEMKKC